MREECGSVGDHRRASHQQWAVDQSGGLLPAYGVGDVNACFLWTLQSRIYAARAALLLPCWRGWLRSLRVLLIGLFVAVLYLGDHSSNSPMRRFIGLICRFHDGPLRFEIARRTSDLPSGVVCLREGIFLC